MFNFLLLRRLRWYMPSCFRHVQLCATLWTIACQAPLSMGFSRQEYWSGLLSPPPGDLLDLGIEPASLKSLALADRFFTISATWEATIPLQNGTWDSKVHGRGGFSSLLPALVRVSDKVGRISNITPGAVLSFMGDAQDRERPIRCPSLRD